MSAFLVAGLVILNVAINVGGTFALKQAAVTGSPVTAALGCSCYVLGASLYIWLLKEQPLAVMAVATSVLGLVAATLIGVLVFQETLRPVHWLGIALALVSVVLISLPVRPS